LNSPEFQDVFFRLPVAELKQVAASLARLRELDWNSLYRHTGYNWDGEFLRLISLHPDHDSA